MIRVALNPSYDIHIEHGLIKKLNFPQKKIAVLVDENVLDLAKSVKLALNSTNKVILLVLPAGEACKTINIYAKTASELAKNDINRDDAIISIGGGSTSDLSGFVAATYLRGIDFYIMPTTLLAMDDACIGGKTAINLPEGKNLVGSFHQPSDVFIDLDILKTLKDDIFRQGAAEIFKHGLLADENLCELILEPGFNANSPKLEEIITRGIQIKVNFIVKDPFDRAERVYLNLGHTLGHAIEAATQHQISHGEAVAYGLHYAMHISKLLGYANLTHLTKSFLAYQRPVSIPKFNFADIIKFMQIDKKVKGDEIRFVILEDIEKPKLQTVDREILEKAWHNFINDL